MLEKHKTGEEKIHKRKYKDAIYFGHFNSDNKRHGKGVMIYCNERRYEGEWDNDLRVGRGFEIHCD